MNWTFFANRLIGTGLTVLRIPDPTLANDVAGATLIATGMGIHVYQANEEYEFSEIIRERFDEALGSFVNTPTSGDFNYYSYQFSMGQITFDEWMEKDPIGLMQTYPEMFDLYMLGPRSLGYRGYYFTGGDWRSWYQRRTFRYWLVQEHPFVAA